MPDEPDNLVLELLRSFHADLGALRADMSAMRADMVTKDELRSEIGSLRADVASDLASMQAANDAEHKRTREQIVGLRRAVVEYHSAVIGHGMLISDLEARVRRLEQHLDLPAIDTH